MSSFDSNLSIDLELRVRSPGYGYNGRLRRIESGILVGRGKEVTSLVVGGGCAAEAQLDWRWRNYMNDSLRSDIFVRHPPETIACACIFLAARLMQISLPKSPSWYEAFRMSEADIEDAAFRILSLYARAKVDVDRVDKIVKDLRTKQQEEKKLKTIGTLTKTIPNNEKVTDSQVTPLSANKSLDSNASVFYGPIKKPSATENKEERRDSSVDNKDRYRDRDRQREKDRSRDRTREKSRERERSRERGRDRSRERARERSRDRSKELRRRSSSSEDRSARKKRKRRSRDRSRSVSLDRRRKHRHRRSRSRPRNTSRVY